VLAFLKALDLPFVERNLSVDSSALEEMMSRTGQERSPCVEIDGVMLADIGREELESYMTAKGFIKGK
jgi:glutaredoxin